MKTKRNSIVVLLLWWSLLGLNQGLAQSSMDSVFMLPDSTVQLSLTDFYKIILRNHPVVKQAGLLSESAQQELRLARGSFDPKLEASYNSKEFKTPYYEQFVSSLSIPTWIPVNPKVGFENQTGQRLNESLTQGDVWFAGVAVPLGRGLFTDERRTAIQQARLLQTMAEAEKIKVINKILLDAAKDYWQWFNAYYQYRLIERNVGIAVEIFRRTKLNADLGEAAVIDTVQAKIILQTRLVERQEALLDFQNTGIQLSNYLWDDKSEPLLLEPFTVPVSTVNDLEIIEDGKLTELVQQATTNHPELVKITVKQEQLEFERRLAAEFLKPRLDVNYFALTPALESSPSLGDSYKFGVDFSIPIFLRKERSKLALSKLKIQNTQYERTQSQRNIINELNQTFNSLRNTQIIFQQQQEMVSLYERLLQAELLNLENGESDLFKINIQQEKLIQSQSKLLKLRAEYQKQKALLYWAAGVQNLNFSTN